MEYSRKGLGALCCILLLVIVKASALAETNDLSFITNGLVSYYPLNGNANDVKGTNHGAVYFAALAGDRFGNPNSCYSFNGTNSHIDFSGDFIVGSPSNSSSIYLWFLAAGKGPIFSDYEGSSSGGDDVFSTQVAIDPTLSASINSLTVASRNFPATGLDHTLFVSSNSFTDQRWHCVVYTLNGAGVACVYVDGLLKTTLGYLPQLSYIDDPHWRAGGGLLFAGERQYFHGLIDEIRVYNRALPAEEIQQLYSIEAPAQIDIARAVKLLLTNLKIGTNYQLQFSYDLNAWMNLGSNFTATVSTNSYYMDADGQTKYFRMQQVQ